MTVKNTFIEEIESQFEELGDLELGTEQYEKTVNGIAKLSDQLIELEKLEVEREKMSDEYAIKTAQMEEDRKDRKVKNWLTGAGIVIPAGVAVWGTVKSIRFEKDGVITTLMGKGWINSMITKMKR